MFKLSSVSRTAVSLPSVLPLGFKSTANAMRLSPLVRSASVKAEAAPAECVNDDRMIGPYPIVKAEKMNLRPQDIKYDDQQGRRNFGEVLHHKYDLLDVWSPDHIGSQPDSVAARYNLYFIGIIAGFSAFCYMIWPEPDFVRRNYPHGGLYKALGGDENTKEIFQAPEDTTA